MENDIDLDSGMGAAQRMLWRTVRPRSLGVIALGGIIIAAGLGLANRQDPVWTPDAASTVAAQEAFAPVAIVAGPLSPPGDDAQNPFVMTAPAGKDTYFVQLRDDATGSVIAEILVPGGEKVATKMPDGSFVVRIAAGETWYGREHLFGRTTGAIEMEEPMVFTTDGEGHHGRSLDLVSLDAVIVGARRIDAAEF